MDESGKSRFPSAVMRPQSSPQPVGRYVLLAFDVAMQQQSAGVKLREQQRSSVQQSCCGVCCPVLAAWGNNSNTDAACSLLACRHGSWCGFTARRLTCMLYCRDSDYNDYLNGRRVWEVPRSAIRPITAHPMSSPSGDASGQGSNSHSWRQMADLLLHKGYPSASRSSQLPQLGKATPTARSNYIILQVRKDSNRSCPR